MLDDVLAAFVSGLGEREFDAPFLMLLRALGFYDIHFLHGPFEFGKDFIAKRDEGGAIVQYTFQTKGGDVDTAAWRDLRGQVDQMRTNVLAHSSFDERLDRRVVVVITGRLVGGAAIDAQQYRDHLEALGEASYKTWDGSTLVEFMRDHPDAGLAGRLSGPLLSLLGSIDENKVTDRDIEQFSRRWYNCSGEGTSLYRAALESAIISSRLVRRSRLDLAMMGDLCLLRAALLAEQLSADQGRDTRPGLLVSRCAREQFRVHGRQLYQRCLALSSDIDEWIDQHNSFSAWVTYPIRCSKLIELVGLLALLDWDESLADWVVEFVDAHPGAAHPASDRWAVSLVPALVCCHRRRPKLVTTWFTEIIRWVSDRYEQGAGLAPADATPEREIDYLAGAALAHIDLPHRSESNLAALILDLGAIVEDAELYGLALNEFAAVGIMPSVTTASDTIEQYKIDGTVHHEPNVQYAEQLNEEALPALHHSLSAGRRRMVLDAGRWWDLLAVSSVLRDRYFLDAVRSAVSFAHRLPAAPSPLDEDSST